MNSWDQINRRRKKHERKQKRKMAERLNESLNPVMEVIRANPDNPNTVLGRLDSLITSDFIADAFFDLYKEVGSDFKTWVKQTLKGYTPQIITKDQYDWITDEEVRRYLSVHGATHIVSITETSRAQAEILIRQILDDAIAEGLSIFETGQLLDDRLPDLWKRVNVYRSERIARTEIVSASNRGSYLGAKESGVDVLKTWLVARDGRERSWHGEMAFRDPVLLDGYFMVPDPDVGSVRMEHPGDASAPAHQNINCRCSIGYVRN